MTSEALLGAGPLEAAIARRDGVAISRRQYLADAAALAERLPPAGAMLNLSVDRYRFAVGLGAALLRGHACLLPPNHTPHTVERLRSRFAGAYALVEAEGEGDGLPSIVHGPAAAVGATAPANPRLAADRVAAYVLTSGSTGDPVPHAKPWGLLAASARAEAARLAEAMRPRLARRLHPGGDRAGAAHVRLRVERAARPARRRGVRRRAAVLSGRRRRRARRHAGAAGAGDDAVPPEGAARVRAWRMPKVELIVCATAPLSPQLAARSEAAFAAPLVEIYGCTEAGQVATRRTTAGAEWQTFAGLTLSGNDDRAVVSGGHVPEPTPLADVLEVLGADRFRLLGRSNDLVNIAGKRSSLSHLNFHLNAIEGVVDGAFWSPPDAADAAGITRLVAFVVAPGLGREQILAALRSRVDAAFLPRRIVPVEALPREPTGKLTAARLAELAAAHGAGSDRR